MAMSMGAAGCAQKPRVPSATIDRCVATIGRLGALPIDQRFAAEVDACADVFLEPRCRDAWRQAPGDLKGVLGREEDAVRACAEVYCPELGAPGVRPRMCDGALHGGFDDPWHELAPRVLAHDDGPAAAQRLIDAAIASTHTNLIVRPLEAVP